MMTIWGCCQLDMSGANIFIRLAWLLLKKGFTFLDDKKVLSLPSLFSISKPAWRGPTKLIELCNNIVPACDNPIFQSQNAYVFRRFWQRNGLLASPRGSRFCHWSVTSASSNVAASLGKSAKNIKSIMGLDWIIGLIHLIFNFKTIHITSHELVLFHSKEHLGLTFWSKGCLRTISWIHWKSLLGSDLASLVGWLWIWMQLDAWNGPAPAPLLVCLMLNLPDVLLHKLQHCCHCCCCCWCCFVLLDACLLALQMPLRAPALALPLVPRSYG